MSGDFIGQTLWYSTRLKTCARAQLLENNFTRIFDNYYFAVFINTLEIGFGLMDYFIKALLVL